MPKSLLVADDSITIQKVVGITFAGEDFRITAVDNGDDALARAREIKPDVILADVVMPRKNGYELCEAIKADPDLRNVPVLLLAGAFEAFDEQRARAVRADGHISKPFESQALINKVRELLGQPASPPVAAPGWAARPPSPASPRPASDPTAAQLPAAEAAGRAPVTVARSYAASRPSTTTPAISEVPGTGGTGTGGTGTGVAGVDKNPRQGAEAPASRPLQRTPSAMRPVPGTPEPGAASASGSGRAQPAQQDLGAPVEIDWGDVDLASYPEGATAPDAGPPNAPTHAEQPPADEPGRGARQPPAQRVDRPVPGRRSPPDAPREVPRTGAHGFDATAGSPKAGVPGTSGAAEDGGEAALRRALEAASRDVIERVVWEVVPRLAETILREQIERLVKERER